MESFASILEGTTKQAFIGLTTEYLKSMEEMTEATEDFNKTIKASNVLLELTKKKEEDLLAPQEKLNAAILIGLAATERRLEALKETVKLVQNAELGAGFGLPIIQRASGGPVGTDSVNARLSPGEFVVNAEAARRHIGQLRALNASSFPSGFQGGGDVTNVGDINVTVQASGNTAVDVANIGRELKRGIRRGTVKFK